jgi:NADPH:quinone reductase-like Zn-dependent oxidoreductase
MPSRCGMWTFAQSASAVSPSPVLKPGGILITCASMPEPEKAAAYGARTAGVPLTLIPKSVLEGLARVIDSGSISPQVRHAFPLPEVADAHAAAEEGHGRGRIVLQVSK